MTKPATARGRRGPKKASELYGELARAWLRLRQGEPIRGEMIAFRFKDGSTERVPRVLVESIRKSQRGRWLGARDGGRKRTLPSPGDLLALFLEHLEGSPHEYRIARATFLRGLTSEYGVHPDHARRTLKAALSLFKKKPT